MEGEEKEGECVAGVQQRREEEEERFVREREMEMERERDTEGLFWAGLMQILIDISPLCFPQPYLYAILVLIINSAKSKYGSLIRKLKYFANSGIYEYNYYTVGYKKTRRMTFHINIILQCP